jgi:hypothetical protein
VKNIIRQSRARLRAFIFASALSSILPVLIAGCGYHFAADGSGLPPQAKTIYVQNFSNKSRQTGINDQLMRYIKDEIADHKRLELVDSASEADLVLTGEVIYADTTPISFNSVNEPLLYGQTMSANATLTDAHTHKVIWDSRGISATSRAPTVASSVVTTSPVFLQQNLRSQDIARMPDLQVAQTQRAASNDQVMEGLAQNLYASMSEGF